MVNRNKEKGSRGEMQLVKEFTGNDWNAKRVPYSGALDSWKGDVEAWTPMGQKLKFEVKVKHNAFKYLYDQLEHVDILAVRKVEKDKRSNYPFLLVMTPETFKQAVEEEVLRGLATRNNT